MKDLFDWSQWNLMRIVRVGMGGFIAFEGVRTEQYLLGLVGLLFLIQGVMNFGCGCSVPQRNYSTKTNNADEITYEEIKP